MLTFNKNEKYLFIDEAGNMGSQGRYFVIACLETHNAKSIHSFMKRKILKAFKTFPELKTHNVELKAKDSYPAVKAHILEELVKKDIKIHYIIADLKHTESRLLIDKNIFYNYLTRLLLDKIIKPNDTTVHIFLDSHSVKVNSTYTLNDYIKLHFNYDLKYLIDFDIRHIISDSNNGYVIQAIDFIVNAIYGNYEFSNSEFYNKIKSKTNTIELFPHKHFGT